MKTLLKEASRCLVAALIAVLCVWSGLHRDGFYEHEGKIGSLTKAIDAQHEFNLDALDIFDHLTEKNAVLTKAIEMQDDFTLELTLQVTEVVGFVKTNKLDIIALQIKTFDGEPQPSPPIKVQGKDDSVNVIIPNGPILALNVTEATADLIIAALLKDRSAR